MTRQDYHLASQGCSWEMQSHIPQALFSFPPLQRPFPPMSPSIMCFTVCCHHIPGKGCNNHHVLTEMQSLKMSLMFFDINTCWHLPAHSSCPALGGKAFLSVTIQHMWFSDFDDLLKFHSALTCRHCLINTSVVHAWSFKVEPNYLNFLVQIDCALQLLCCIMHPSHTCCPGEA